MNEPRRELRVAGEVAVDELTQFLDEVGWRIVGAVEESTPGLSTSVVGEAREDLFSAARERAWDVALLPEAEPRPGAGVIAFDCDSTLVVGEGIDDLAARAGVRTEVAAITDRAMAGELDYAESLRERVRLLRGLGNADLRSVASEIRLRPGAEACVGCFRDAGWYTMVVSGGFEFYLKEVQRRLGLDEIVGNRLALQDGVLTGEVEGAVVGAAEKRAALQAAVGSRRATGSIAVGDGANDLLMLREARLGVGMRSRPTLDGDLDVFLGGGDFGPLPWLCRVPEDSAF